MANLKEIRIRLNSVKSTRQITSAMKMVSAAKLRRAQESILQLRPFYLRMNEILKHVNASIDDSHDNIFARPQAHGRILIVVITSNRGLCGAFNGNIVKRSIQCIHELYPEALQDGRVDIIAIGKKGADLLKAKNFKALETHHHLFDKLTFDNTIPLANQMIEDFIKGKYDTIRLVYNQFRNAAVQEVTDEIFLPVLHTPDTGDRFQQQVDYIFEPSGEGIFDEMIPYSLRVQFFRALLESNASEHGARMTAMHKATDNATELIKELELNYNKARQAAITNEILEIVGGANALKG
jgi:F-type H+-transporting ATPase subunit gamma